MRHWHGIKRNRRQRAVPLGEDGGKHGTKISAGLCSWASALLRGGGGGGGFLPPVAAGTALEPFPLSEVEAGGKERRLLVYAPLSATEPSYWGGSHDAGSGGNVRVANAAPQVELAPPCADQDCVAQNPP